MKILKVKDWKTFQHYHTREKRPGWIKLYRSILDDFDFHSLPVESRAILPMIWLLAVEKNGEVENNYEKIGFRIRLSARDVEKALKPLIEKGFLVESSESLDSVYSESSLERERELEQKEEIEEEEEGSGSAPDLWEVVEIYNTAARKIGLPVCQVLTAKRKASLKARLKEAGGLDGWRHAIRMMSESPFLAGENDRGWKASFDFLLQPASFTKLMEGAYSQHRGKKQKHDPSLETARALGIIPHE